MLALVLASWLVKTRLYANVLKRLLLNYVDPMSLSPGTHPVVASSVLFYFFKLSKLLPEVFFDKRMILLSERKM